MEITEKTLKALHQNNFMDKPMLAAIAKDPYRAYKYSLYVLEGPFPAGEAIIAKAPSHFAYEYARYTLKDPDPDTWAERFEEAHK